MSQEHFAQSDIEEGLLAGLWRRPVDGFVWSRDYKSLSDPRDSGPWLIPIEKSGWERYPVLQHRALLDDFISLGKNPTARRVRARAKRYGPLGVWVQIEPHGGGDVVLGESLHEWQWHSRAVATWSQLFEWLERGDATSLSPFVRWQQRPVGVGIRIASLNGRPDGNLATRVHVSSDYTSFGAMPQGAFWDGGMLASEEYDPERILTELRYRDSIEPIRLYLHMRVNQALRERITRTILYPSREIRYFPVSLLGAIYVRLQDHLTPDSRLAERRCHYSGCRNLFIPRRRDQIYCSRPCRQAASYHKEARK